MYQSGEYDIAGFALGAVEKNNMLPRLNLVRSGDVIIGLPSSGIHSNGFSLVRRVLLQANLNYTHRAPFSSSLKTLGNNGILRYFTSVITFRRFNFLVTA